MGVARNSPGVSKTNIGGWQSRKAINFLEEGARQAGAGGVAVQRLHLRIVRRTTISPPWESWLRLPI